MLLALSFGAIVGCYFCAGTGDLLPARLKPPILEVPGAYDLRVNVFADGGDLAALYFYSYKLF